MDPNTETMGFDKPADFEFTCRTLRGNLPVADSTTAPMLRSPGLFVLPAGSDSDRVHRQSFQKSSGRHRQRRLAPVRTNRSSRDQGARRAARKSNPTSGDHVEVVCTACKPPKADDDLRSGSPLECSDAGTSDSCRFRRRNVFDNVVLFVIVQIPFVVSNLSKRARHNGQQSHFLLHQLCAIKLAMFVGR
jgi:hypothetical protein